ncbi:hypothetical protein HID58_005943 [Brassica napus]|uniref:Uncharacterized protein n=1 Tax=Brassica napus TaxID=3708 RepID=A0ABQ8EAQ8_BRANA|nr:hypothetical protein HID58_005943 [Brassica napus]
MTVDRLSSGPGGKRFEDKIVDTLKKYVNEGAYLSKKWLKKHFAYSFSKKKKTLCLFNHLSHLHTCKYLSNLIASPKVLLIDDVTMPTQDTKPEITLHAYSSYIKEYVVGLDHGRIQLFQAHAHSLHVGFKILPEIERVHAYKHRNEHEYIHFKLFRQDSYKINEIEVDGLFTAFTGSLHNFQASTTAPGSNCFIDPPS